MVGHTCSVNISILEINHLNQREKGKLRVYIFVFHYDYNIKKERQRSIRLTSMLFYVRKEVIIVLYTADEARPGAAEGWTKQPAPINGRTCSKLDLQTRHNTMNPRPEGTKN